MPEALLNWLDYHRLHQERAGYPLGYGPEDRPSLQEAENGGYVSYLIRPPLPLPDLAYPVIAGLALFGVSPQQALELVAGPVGAGAPALFQVESYNRPVLDLLDLAGAETTYFHQQKLLAPASALVSDSRPEISGVRIRNLDPDQDLSLYASFYNQVLGFLGSLVDETFMASVISRPSFDPRGYFLAQSGDETVGFIAVEKEPFGPGDGEFGYIFQIGVAESFQGSQLAGLLLERAGRYLLDQGVSRVGIGVRGSNHRALAFLKKSGFKPGYSIRGFMANTVLPGEQGS